jgi:hypothetical protein
MGLWSNRKWQSVAAGLLDENLPPLRPAAGAAARRGGVWYVSAGTELAELRALKRMKCPECKYHCPAKAVSCDRCGAALVQPRAYSPLGGMSGLVCLGVVLIKLCVPASATRDRPPGSSPSETSPSWRSSPPSPSRQFPPPAAARPAGPTLNGVPYDRSPFVRHLDPNQPAPPAPRR